MPAPSSLFMERMIRFLMPYFATITSDLGGSMMDELSGIATPAPRPAAT